MGAVVACLIAASVIVAPRAMRTPPHAIEGGEIAAETTPLDLDRDGRYEWLSVRFRLPGLRAGTYWLTGHVAVPTDTGLAIDLIHHRGASSYQAEDPGIQLRCAEAICAGEAWLSGRSLARARADSAVSLQIECHDLAIPFGDSRTYTIHLRRNDWRKFGAPGP